MVVILIVNSAESPFPNTRGEQLSTTNTTSISFVSSSSSSQVDPDNSIATTKDEEWVTKKKVELTTKRQIETRVKRQVVLEDGKVVEDSGPIVTTNTTEDTEKQESSQTEHRQLGDDEADGAKDRDGWVVAPAAGGLVKEVKEKTVKTREEKEERLETEDVQHLGDISDDAYLSAVQWQSQGGGDLRSALQIHRPTPEGRVVHQSSKTRRTVDTDDRRHLSELQPDGRLVTETRRTTDHEEVNNTEEPDDGRLSGEEEDTHKRSSQHYKKTKDQEFVEYLADGKKIGGEMRYEAENVQGDRKGDPSMLAMEHQESDSLSARLRKIRRNKLQREGMSPLDRKDALTKKPLDFDQEEETRKMETSKWLEHHFGSESRSSKDSIGDDDLPQTGTSTSFINVTMTSTKNRVNRVPSPVEHSTPKSPAGNSSSRVFVSSPDAENPPPTNYFQGISEWKTVGKDYHSDRPSRMSATGLRDRVQVLPAGPNHTFGAPSPPFPSSSNGSKNFKGSQGSNLNGRNSSGPESGSPFQSITDRHSRYYRQTSPSGDRSSPYHAKGLPISNGHRTSSEEEPPRATSPRGPRRYSGHTESEDQRLSNRLIQREREYFQRLAPEPAPDYSPPSPRVTPSPSPPPQVSDAKKKVYQRTRFAADIPPVQKAGQSTQTQPHKTTLGESFRKFVGKFRSASKEKRRGKKGSRSPSPQDTNTYQGFPLPGGGSEDTPLAPPRYAKQRHSETGTQTMRRGDNVVHRYYLGEDPFGGSIYGREKEYDGVTPFRRKHRRPSDALEQERNARNEQLSTSTSTLGRFSKSTGRLASDQQNYEDRGGVQTLPRKLHAEHKAKKQVYITKSNMERVSSPNSWESQRHTKTMDDRPGTINVSIVNKTGPAKPARTYRSLLRSKSFNVHAGDSGPDFDSVHKSNPQLHRLDESPPPLKSPGIVTSISRSTKDISQAVDDEDNYRRTFVYDDHSVGLLNGYVDGRATRDTKKKIFMKNLQDRAPELFRTLHGNEVEDTEDRRRMYTSTPVKNGQRVVDYTNSFRSSNTSSPLINGSDRVHSPTYTTSITHTPSFRNNGEVVNRSVVRRAGNNDYSETVRITSKSDDPLRPSVTNTVQSFTKKTLPGKGGRGKETIESSETKTVTKSRFRGGDPNIKYHESSKYPSRNSGVVIQVRNNSN